MFIKFILFPYYLILKIRHSLYDKGIRKVHQCEVPTICVGNITAGGTGKTPHTEMIIRTLLENEEWKNKNLAVLSRGHKRSSRGFQQVTIDGQSDFYGDEPLQIKKKFPQITVAVDRNRIEGCNFLCNPEKLNTEKKGRNCRDKEFPKSDLIVLDDAFQYRDLKADYNIILVNYNRPVNKDCLLPFGRLRDLPERLDYADIIIVSKCPSYLDEWEREKWLNYLNIKQFNSATRTGINEIGKQIIVLFSTIHYCPLKPVFEEANNRYIYSEKLIMFSGIAKDTNFKMFLSDKYKIVKRFKFADHHKYRKYDINRIKKYAKSFPTAVIATTEKDSQRIHDYKKMPLPLRERMFQAPIQVVFLTDREKKVFEENLFKALKEPRPEPALKPHE